jgi:hypothetical protein
MEIADIRRGGNCHLVMKKSRSVTGCRVLLRLSVEKSHKNTEKLRNGFDFELRPLCVRTRGCPEER